VSTPVFLEQVRFRTACRADYAQVLAVLPSWWGGRDLSALLQPLFFENFASTSLMAEDASGAMLGFLVGFPSADEPTAAYVHFLGVNPIARHAGLGRRLHDLFAEMMGRRGVVEVRCVTAPVNKVSIAFHRAIGFAVESTDELYVHFVRHWTPAVRSRLRMSTQKDDSGDEEPLVYDDDEDGRHTHMAPVDGAVCLRDEAPEVREEHLTLDEHDPQMHSEVGIDQQLDVAVCTVEEKSNAAIDACVPVGSAIAVCADNGIAVETCTFVGEAGVGMERSGETHEHAPET
jgi:GNAT superfamily N-acetyltransferase